MTAFLLDLAARMGGGLGTMIALAGALLLGLFYARKSGKDAAKLENAEEAARDAAKTATQIVKQQEKVREAVERREQVEKEWLEKAVTPAKQVDSGSNGSGTPASVPVNQAPATEPKRSRWQRD